MLTKIILVTGWVHQEVKQAKRQYRIKIEYYYTGSDARRMWQGLKTVTDYKGKPRRELPSDASLTDELNTLLCSHRGKQN
jgi:hypothetical protein